MDLAAPSKYPLTLVSGTEAWISLQRPAFQTIVLSLSFGAFQVSDLDLQNVSLVQMNCPIFVIPLFLFLVRLSFLHRNVKATSYFVCRSSWLIRVWFTNVFTLSVYTILSQYKLGI
jgi:hypothetical protein